MPTAISRANSDKGLRKPSEMQAMSYCMEGMESPIESERLVPGHQLQVVDNGHDERLGFD